ncbi:MAG: ArsR/SmtB family transcription factor [bacterium]
MTNGSRPLREFELALKAAADPTRTRVLKLLEAGELCVCQVQAVLGLAVSTVSKHLSILKAAGLVEDRRAGKWIAYRLTRADESAYVKPVLAMLRGAIERDPVFVADAERLRRVLEVPLGELCAAPPPRSVLFPKPRRTRAPRRAGRL